MKKNDWILIISVILYSWMFYQQTPGINFLIFSVAAILLLIWREPSNLKDTKWYVAASGTLVSGICVALFGTALSVVANVVSLSLLSAYSVSRNSSVILAGLYSIYSFLSAIGFMIADMIRRKSGNTQTRGSRFWIRLGIGAGILIVLIVFFVLYQRSNPLFLDLTRKIKLDFISWPWVRFTFLGFVLLYGFFYHRNFPSWLRWDAARSNYLDAEAIKTRENKIFGKAVNIRWEISSGLVLLILLNLLLLVVNTLDIYYLWLNPSELPAGMTYSDYVHQGTTNMIISIAIAILIILFFFRNHLNYAEGNKPIKTMAAVWILQNIIVLISTGYRNYLYVYEYSLTYRRLGVYIWLTLTLIGLITTFVKIYRKKSNWYLFRANGWAFYIVLVLFACQNWDLVITKFNIEKKNKVDKYYLLSMGSPAVLPVLMQLPADTTGITSDYAYDERFTEYSSYDSEESYDPYYRPDFNEELNRRMYEFLNEYKSGGWQSWNRQDQQTANEIYKLSETGVFKKLSLKGMNLDSVEFADVFRKINELDISNNHMQNFNDLASFTQLQTLKVASNSLSATANIPQINTLENLYISGNYISEFSGITRQKNLKKLDISNNTYVIDLRKLSALNKLTELNVSGDDIPDYSALKQFPELKNLDLSRQKNTELSKVPPLEKLEQINLSGNTLNSSNAGLILLLNEFKSLRKIDLSSNSVSSLYILTNYFTRDDDEFGFFRSTDDLKPLFVNLEDLSIASNSVSDLEALELYPKLKRLNVSSNSISDISVLKRLTDLEYLNVSSTMITSFDSLSELKNLKELDISGTNVANGDVLKKLDKLEILRANNCQLSDYRFLKVLKSLKLLEISNNYFSDINFLRDMKSLEVLYMTGNTNITDYSPLYQLDKLKVVYLDSYVDGKVKRALKENMPGVRIVYGYSASSYR